MHLIKKTLLTLVFSIALSPSAYAQWTANSMMLAKLIRHVEVSPDGKKIAYTVVRHIKVNNLWQDDIQIFLSNIENNKTHQLTHEKNEATLPEWSPDGNYIAFVTKVNHGSALKIIRADGAKAWTLVQSKTPIEKLKWSPDSTKIAYLKDDPKTQEDPPEPIVFSFINLALNNLWIIDLNKQKKASHKPEQLTQYSQKLDLGSIGAINWSPDNTHLAFIRFSPKTDAYWATGTLISINVKNKKKRLLVKTKMMEHFPHFSPDGKYIAFLGASRAYVIPSQGGKPKQLGITPDQSLLSLIGWSADGKHIYVQEYYHTGSNLLSLSTDGKQVTVLNPQHKLMNYISLNASHTTFGFNRQDSNHPEEAFISATKTFKPIQVSHVNGNLPTYPLGITQIIHWHSTDGKIIEGLLTYPVNYQKGKSYPLLVENHGGPGFVFQQYFIARRSVYPICVFASQGYFYFRPNIRGSSGYGAAFRNSNHKDWGGADYHDMLSGVQYLIDQGLADPNHLGILGWSFGGYMGAWAVTQTQQFKAAALGGAITDLISYAGTGDLAHFIPNAFGGYFWNNAKLYLERSPIMHVKNVKTPVLLLNGQLDYRVPPTQSEEFYRALKLRSIPSKVILYPETYHSIRIPYLIVDAAKRNIAWMNQYVKSH